MKIFHGPENIGGMAGVLARGQRALGADAISYCRETPSYGFRSDRTFVFGSKSRQAFERLRFLALEAASFDVFHLYFGASLTGQHLYDVPWLRRFGKRVFFYFCGCDIRDSKATIERYEYSACAECWPMSCNANRKNALQTATENADGAFVSTPDLLEFVPGSVLLPQPIELAELEQLVACEPDEATEPLRSKRRDREGPVVVAHGPSARALKGTRFLEAAIEELQQRGVAVELRLVEGVSHATAVRMSAEADLVVDQLLVGSYGQYAVEMMALGKPVICYIRPDLRQHYPDTLPIISATPATIASTIEQWIDRRDEWAELGQRGVAYVRGIHDSVEVARHALNSYRGELTRCA